MNKDKQQEAIGLINKGESIFITGSAGKGKSWVIDQVADNNTILAAPTGIAALNIGGSTCHKLFSLPIGLPQPSDKYTISKKTRGLFSTHSNVKRLIIDEIGMLRVDYFDLISEKLKIIRNNDKPFGGLQVVVVGDFFQLEPIVSQKEWDIFFESYSSSFCFTSNNWIFKTIELDKVYRQSDERQVRILNSIRTKDKYYELALKRIIEECKHYDYDEDILHLCCYKNDAESINKKHYNKLTTQQYTFNAHITGIDKWNDSPVPLKLELKEGCKVLVCANDIDGEYVNGDRGIVKNIYNNKIILELENGKEVVVDKFTWEKYDYTKIGKNVIKNIISTMRQFPLRLGWAITIHKSQGMTLNDCAIDIGRGCFSHGQCYMALSRIRDLKNMSLANPIHPNNIIVRQEVIDFYDRLN